MRDVAVVYIPPAAWLLVNSTCRGLSSESLQSEFVLSQLENGHESQVKNPRTVVVGPHQFSRLIDGLRADLPHSLLKSHLVFYFFNLFLIFFHLVF